MFFWRSESCSSYSGNRFDIIAKHPRNFHQKNWGKILSFLVGYMACLILNASAEEISTAHQTKKTFQLFAIQNELGEKVLVCKMAIVYFVL